MWNKKKRKTNLRKINWRETKEAKRGGFSFFWEGQAKLRAALSNLNDGRGMEKRKEMQWNELILSKHEKQQQIRTSKWLGLFFVCFVLPLLNVKVLEFWLRSSMMTERDVSFLPFYSNLFCLYFLCLSPLTFLNAWDNAGTNHNSLTKIREWKVISSWKKLSLE